MATEKILMEAVARGKSRQEMHELVKVHSVAAGSAVKEDGRENDLLRRLAADSEIPFTLDELTEMVRNSEQFAGRAKEQTEEFLEEVVFPLLAENRERIGKSDAILTV